MANGDNVFDPKRSAAGRVSFLIPTPPPPRRTPRDRFVSFGGRVADLRRGSFSLRYGDPTSMALSRLSEEERRRLLLEFGLSAQFIDIFEGEIRASTRGPGGAIGPIPAQPPQPIPGQPPIPATPTPRPIAEIAQKPVQVSTRTGLKESIISAVTLEVNALLAALAAPAIGAKFAAQSLRGALPVATKISATSIPRVTLVGLAAETGAAQALEKTDLPLGVKLPIQLAAATLGGGAAAPGAISAAVRGTGRAGLKALAGPSLTERMTPRGVHAPRAQALAPAGSQLSRFQPRAPVVRQGLVASAPTETSALVPRAVEKITRGEFVNDIGDVTPRVFQETNPQGLERILAFGGEPHGSRFSFANDPALALGQGGSRGVLIEFSAKGIPGRVQLTKPAAEFSLQRGSAEFFSDAIQPTLLRDKILSVTVKNLASTKRAFREILDVNFDRVGKTSQGTVFRPKVKVPPAPDPVFRPQGTTAELFAERLGPLPSKVTRTVRVITANAVRKANEVDPIVTKIRHGIEKGWIELKKVEEAKSLELGTRVGEFQQVQRAALAAGQNIDEATRAALTRLGGELPKGELRFAEGLVQTSDVEYLMQKVWDYPGFPRGEDEVFARLNAHRAIAKLLTPDQLPDQPGSRKGSLPTKSELLLLDEVFGPQFAKALIKKGAQGPTVWDTILAVNSIPRAIITAYDMSAVLRQGMILSAAHPVSALRAFSPMVKSFAKEKWALEGDDVMRGMNWFEHSRRMGLRHDALTRAGRRLGAGEVEVFSNIPDWVRKIPGIRPSERAYVTFLNKLRQDVYAGIARGWEGKGATDAEYRSLAKFLNRATGVGDFGPKAFEQFAPILNLAFFAPKLAISRIQAPLMLLDPRTPLRVRKLIAKDMVAFSGVAATIMWLVDFADIAQVNANPKSANFGRMQFGDAGHVDFLGGFAPTVRYGWQALTGERVTDKGTLEAVDQQDTFFKFVRSKLAPVAGAIVTVQQMENFLGEQLAEGPGGLPGGLLRLLADTITPLIAQDFHDAWNEMGMKGIAAAIPSFFGASTLFYRPMAVVQDEVSRELFKDSVTGEGLNYDQITPTQKRQVQAHPRVEHEYNKTADPEERQYQRDLQKVADDFDSALADDLNKSKEFVKRLRTLQQQRAIRQEKSWSRFKESGTPNQKAVWRWHDTFKQSAIAGGVDFEKLERLQAELVERWDAATLKYVRDNTGATRVPKTIANFLDHQRKKRDNGWHTVHKRMPGAGIFVADYERWREIKDDRNARAEFTTNNPAKAGMMIRIEARVRELHAQMRRDDPVLDVGEVTFFDAVPRTPTAQAMLMAGKRFELQAVNLLAGKDGPGLNVLDRRRLAEQYSSLVELAEADDADITALFGKRARDWGLPKQAQRILDVLSGL